jgi:hypothetical protein
MKALLGAPAQGRRRFAVRGDRRDASGPVMPRNRVHTIETALPTVRIRVMDCDSNSGDE